MCHRACRPPGVLQQNFNPGATANVMQINVIVSMLYIRERLTSWLLQATAFSLLLCTTGEDPSVPLCSFLYCETPKAPELYNVCYMQHAYCCITTRYTDVSSKHDCDSNV